MQPPTTGTPELYGSVNGSACDDEYCSGNVDDAGPYSTEEMTRFSVSSALSQKRMIMNVDVPVISSEELSHP